MTKIKRQKVLVALMATFALAACASITSLSEKNKVSVAESVVITPDETAATTEFYMNEGAEISAVGDDVSGIHFTATLTEAYWEALQTTYGPEATYKFYSVVTDGTTGIQRNFSLTTPNFTEGEKEFVSSITYKVSEWSQDKKDEAYALELEANTYVDVTVGETTTTIAANGSTGACSIRVIANDLYLTETSEWYQSEALEAYLTVANRSEETWGGFDSTGAGVVNMPTLPSETTEVSAYLGTQKLTASVSDGKISFSGVDTTDMTVGDEVYLSVFVGAKVYSCKVAYSTALLDANNVSSTLATATEGYYVLKDNIDMSSITYSPSATFTGTLNGIGFAIKNQTIGNSAGGVLNVINGATVKNLAIVNATVTGTQSGILAVQTGENASTVENVYISGSLHSATESFNGAINCRSTGGAGLKLNNVIINLAVTADVYNGYVSGMNRRPLAMSNCYFIGGNGQISGTRSGYTPDTSNSDMTTVKTYADSKAYVEALNASENAITLPTDLLKKYSKSDIEDKFILLTKSNFADLATATDGYYLLTDDITIGTDEGEVSYPTPSVTFKGTLDGNGHTISNLSVGDAKGGLFATLSGATIKNLAIVNATIAEGYSQSGIIAQTTSTGTHTIENVFVSGSMVGKSTADGQWNGGIIGKGWNGTLALKNVIVKLADCADDDVTTGFVCGFTRGNQPITLENCYFIGGNGQTSGVRAGNYTEYIMEGSKNIYTDVSAFNEAYSELTLTEKLSAWCDKYLKSTPAQSSID